MLPTCMPSLLPQPKSVNMAEGIFEIDDRTCITLETGTSTVDLPSADRLKKGIARATGYDLPLLKMDRARKQHEVVLSVIPKSCSPESYLIRISADAVLVEGASSAGLRYGVETLLQIINQCGIDLPALEIQDSPDFPVRGFYHDVTRGQVPTLDTMKYIADLCVAYKINHLELYIEHSFLFPTMREIGAGMDPITGEEILELDRYCRERHIDLVPSISTFGHMYEVLRTRSFHHLNELEIDAGQLPYNWRDRMMHYTLDVNNPESIELIRRMFDEFLPLFTSDFVNICCDETFDLGKGRNSKTDPKDLYIKHLLAVIDLVRARGKRAMFWGDMVIEYRELLEKLPKDIVALNWHYGPVPPEETSEQFEKTGLTQYVCPGISAWSGFSARISAAESNIRHMATYGKKYHAEGLLNTNWGDHGHINLLSASMHGIVMGAAYAWNVDGTPEKDAYDDAFSIVSYGDESRQVGRLLRRLGDADPYRFWMTYDEPFDVIKGWGVDKFGFDAQKLRANMQTAGEIERELAHLRVSADSKARVDYDEFIWSGSMIKAVNNYALLIIGEDPGDRKALASEFERLYDEYASLWRKRNKESELFRIREAMLRTARRIREA